MMCTYRLWNLKFVLKYEQKNKVDKPERTQVINDTEKLKILTSK